MTNYIHLTLEELFDLLSAKTDKLSEIFRSGQYGSKEYEECLDLIREIQRIIRQKKKLQSGFTELPNDRRGPDFHRDKLATGEDNSTSADFQ